jgi:predicted nucleic acid-binding protein
MIPRAVLDANVLAAEVVRDFILSLAEQDCLRPMWSPELGLELQRALVRMKVAPVVADKIWQLLNEAFPFASEVDVGTAFPDVRVRDPHDLHVAQIAFHADYLVTFNVRDFPSRIGTTRVVHPDEFTLERVSLQPKRALWAIETMCARRTRSMPTRSQLLESPAQNRLTATAEFLGRLGG